MVRGDFYIGDSNKQLYQANYSVFCCYFSTQARYSKISVTLRLHSM